MSEKHKEILIKANAAVSEGKNEDFLNYCTDDVTWTFVGEQSIKGKDKIRKYMEKTYISPPEFDIVTIISEGDYLTAVGSIRIKDSKGRVNTFEYCDVWKFRDGLMAELKAFVIPVKD